MNSSYLWTGQRAVVTPSWRTTASRTAAVIFFIMLLFLALGG